MPPRPMKRKGKYGGPATKKVATVKSSSSKAMAERSFGNKLFTTMDYFQTVGLNPATLGAASTNIFRLSSIHDPDATGVGHQPMFHDQMSPIFERYQVYKVEYHIEFSTTGTGDINNVGYYITDQNATSIDPELFIENGNVEWGHCVSRDGGGTKRFFGSTELNTIHGITKKQYMANDDYGASFGSNPVEQAFLNVFAEGLGTDTDSVLCSIHLKYHVRLMGTKLASKS